jgi:pyruvate ferredoxin oxidoreductase gamma subunit
MLGAVIKATAVLTLNAMKSPLEHRFGRVAAKNMSAMKRAFSEMKAAKAA